MHSNSCNHMTPVTWEAFHINITMQRGPCTELVHQACTSRSCPAMVKCQLDLLELLQVGEKAIMTYCNDMH